MIFIYGDTKYKDKIPFITALLMMLCLLLWIISATSFDNNDFKMISIIPAYFFDLERPENITFIHNYFTLVTSVFFHSGFFHLLGNMILFWALAPTIEEKIGHFQFLFLFIGCGIVGALLYALQNQDSVVGALGASGAISGIMGTYLALFPQQNLKCIFWFFHPIKFEVPAYTLILLYFVLDYYYASTGMEEVDMIAYWDHVGGFIFGLIIGLVEKKRLIDEDIQKPDKDWYA